MKNPGYYAVIPAPVRYHASITPNGKLLYGEITALCEKEGFCWASNGYFAALYGVSGSAISEWVQSLRKAGFIRIEIDKGRGNERKIYLVDPLRPKANTSPPNGVDPSPPKAEDSLLENSTKRIKSELDLGITPTNRKLTTKKAVLAEAESIYALYPKKVARPEALKAIIKAMDRVGLLHLRERTRAYANARGKDLQFVPHPATWFNQERYDDDPKTWLPNGATRPAAASDEPVGWKEWLQGKPAEYRKACDGRRFSACSEWIRREFEQERKAAK